MDSPEPMSNPSSHPERPDSAESTAAMWLARHDRGLSACEQDEYLSWLSADPQHGQVMLRLQKTWGVLDTLRDWRPAHSEKPNPDLLAGERRRRFTARTWGAMAAVAAVLALGLFVLVQRPDGKHLVAESYQQSVLEDGSIVELNRGAAIDVIYTAAERRVRLSQGEAYFTVAKNRARPFVVQAGLIEVRAVGTAFNVRLESESIEVLVTEGRVILNPAAQAQPAVPTEASAAVPTPPLLVAGQRAVIAQSAGGGFSPVLSPLSTDEIARSLGWQPRRLEFAETSLDVVASQFNRYNDRQLVIEDPSVSALMIGGTFSSNNLDGFVRLLEASFGIEAEARGNQIVLRRKESGAP